MAPSPTNNSGHSTHPLNEPRRIVVTGASGFVGQQLVPRLQAQGASVLLVGRDPQRLAQMFPQAQVCDYDALPTRAQGWDMLVHLAVANSDTSLPDQEVFAINVDLLQHTAQSARTAGIRRFVNMSSAHALQPGNDSAYARSKRAGTEAVEALATADFDVETLYLPLIWGDRWAGKLAVLSSWPRPLAKIAFTALAALKPTCHVDSLAARLLTIPKISHPDHSLLSDDIGANPVYSWSKRLLDLGIVAVILVLAGWLMVLVWAAVRLSSKGPGIFAQTRVGRNGKPFTCYKFRTMKQGTRQAGTHEVTAASVTKIGHILRKTKIDELPQIVNVVCNQLSFVGPRPGLPVQEELFAARDELGVFSVKPGITGLAQINDIDMSDPRRLAIWDARYIQQRSLISDLRIIIATATGGGQGDKIKN